MLKTLEYPDGIIELVLNGGSKPGLWHAYEDLMLAHLENRYHRLYVITNIEGLGDYAPLLNALPTATFLGHPMMGRCVLVTSPALCESYRGQVAVAPSLAALHGPVLIFTERAHALQALYEQRERDETMDFD